MKLSKHQVKFKEGTTHVIIPDPHSHPQHANNRATWAGNYIREVRPDTVVVLGDTADMPSLCSHNRGTKSFQGRTYAAGIAAHNEFQDRLWSTVKEAKKRLPRRVTLIGNHEQRIDRAIQVQPELEGVVSYGDLQLDHWYNDVVHYEGATPGSIEIDGVTYAHYLVSGISGRPISGEHHAHSLLTKHHSSCTVGHSHVLDYCIRTRADGSKIMGLSAGVFVDFRPSFAGSANNLWNSCLIKKTFIQPGMYDLEVVSLDRLRKEYS